VVDGVLDTMAAWWSGPACRPEPAATKTRPAIVAAQAGDGSPLAPRSGSPQAVRLDPPRKQPRQVRRSSSRTHRGFWAPPSNTQFIAVTIS